MLDINCLHADTGCYIIKLALVMVIGLMILLLVVERPVFQCSLIAHVKRLHDCKSFSLQMTKL